MSIGVKKKKKKKKRNKKRNKFFNHSIRNTPLKRNFEFSTLLAPCTKVYFYLVILYIDFE
ncbi:predicted protein [Saccharomyces cerevisiae RM11-1a]|uniref:Uncharacterized protein n=1 Tax=Saccharomyces cerevisiae (strain RM11-1a) TaxID=285006 RepID=B3LNX0_YEAS1|nr:predicted protein [Saccharomyces cerevisiae RM11-1a]